MRLREQEVLKTEPGWTFRDLICHKWRGRGGCVCTALKDEPSLSGLWLGNSLLWNSGMRGLTLWRNSPVSEHLVYDFIKNPNTPPCLVFAELHNKLRTTLSLPSTYLTDVIWTQEVSCRWRMELSHLKKRHVEKLRTRGHSLQAWAHVRKLRFGFYRMNLSAVFCLCQIPDPGYSFWNLCPEM